ncbi:mechanosensitive ion channel domain-containing protein [Lusitaniella coriacea]|nr:mechanosensitive ion channel domain-containing protein [Lusitaniella coriacea]
MNSFWNVIPKLRFQRRVKTILSAIALCCIVLWGVPAFALSMNNPRLQTAPIVVDGRGVFRVGSLEEFPARDRAEIINEILDEQVKNGKPLSVEVAEKEGQTTLQVGNTHLLTVTLQDVKKRPGVWSQAQQKNRLNAQAKNWQNILNSALQQAYQERTPSYIKQSLLWSLGIILGAIALYWSLTALRRWLLPPRAQSTQQQKLRLTLTCLQLGIGLAAIYAIAGLFPLTRRWRYELWHSLTAPIVPLGEVNWSVFDLFLLLGLTVGLWFAVKWFSDFLTNRILSFAGVDRGIQNTVGLLTQYGLVFLGLLVIFQSLGIDLASLTLIASAFGLGIGFGLQNVASNFISGLIITFDRPIKVGDFVRVGDLVGTVERIGSRSTEIITLDQVSILVPNSRFVDGEVINWSYGNPVSRLRVSVGIAYGSPIPVARKALLEAAKNHPEVLRYPAPQVWLQEFGDSSLNFDLFVWIREPPKQFKIKSELNYRIEASLQQYGIEIPFPQRDLHLRSPQMDEMVATWMRQNASQMEREAYFQRWQVEEEASRKDMRDRAESQNEPSDPNAFKLGEEVDIDALVEQMRGENGIEIKDRRYGLSVYPQTFLGSEAVEWLMRTQNSGIKAAIQLGQLLVERGIIHHVLDEHDFKNERLFYRFYQDEEMP